MSKNAEYEAAVVACEIASAELHAISDRLDAIERAGSSRTAADLRTEADARVKLLLARRHLTSLASDSESTETAPADRAL